MTDLKRFINYICTKYGDQYRSFLEVWEKEYEQDGLSETEKILSENKFSAKDFLSLLPDEGKGTELRSKIEQLANQK